MKLDAHAVTACAMQWARFKKGLFVVDQCTVGHCNADIVGIDYKKKLSYEIEVKVSKYDMCVLEKKKYKYHCGESPYLTDYFYVAVPIELIELARIEFPENVGIIYVEGFPLRGNANIPAFIARSAKRNLTAHPFERIFNEALLRAGSCRAIAHVDNALLARKLREWEETKGATHG